MSEGFTSEGYETFPSLYSDSTRIHDVVDWSNEMLEQRMNEYTEFLSRPDLMPRAKKTANFILDCLMLEAACRDGVYDYNATAELKLKDEVCEGNF